MTGDYGAFVAEWRAKVTEVIDRYSPDLMWFDGGRFREPRSQALVCELLAHYLNAGLAREQEVVVLNKLPAVMKFNFPRPFGLLAFEQGRDRMPGIERPWLDDVNIADRSWGYVENQTYRSATYVLHALIDSTARGGGIFLSLAPRADGTIPEAQVATLRGVGDRMRVNGDAIYGTHPWRIQAEGPTTKVWPDQLRAPWRFYDCDAADIRFTHKDRTLYAIVMGWLADRSLAIASLSERTYLGESAIRRIRLLGVEQPLRWTRDGEGLHIELPQAKPHDHAYVFKIEDVEA